MSRILFHPHQEVTHITSFLKNVFTPVFNRKAVIAVSGGIDSAVSLSLITQAIGANRVFPLFLPFADQSIEDSHTIASFHGIPEQNWTQINIKPMVMATAKTLGIDNKSHLTNETDTLRLGNIMARCRMIAVYDFAKQHGGLVCGTENKSEKFLGYFTRFGDEASDVEPIVHLYKTQVRQLARFLDLPQVFLEKEPSAGLWPGQTDENELGFSYDQADVVLHHLEERNILQNYKSPDFIDMVERFKMNQLDAFSQEIDISKKKILQIIDRVQAVAFKHQVPYTV